MALNSIRPSSVNHRPPSSGNDWTLLDTTTWVCRSGSPVRESRWSNAAATNPVTGTCRMPPLPTRVNATSRSSIARVARTASWCAASTCWATSAGARAHRAETDFTGENVRSNPATGTCAGRDADATNLVSSASSTGARPCRCTNASRATWVRIAARSSAGIGWFHARPLAGVVLAERPRRHLPQGRRVERRERPPQRPPPVRGARRVRRSGGGGPARTAASSAPRSPPPPRPGPARPGRCPATGRAPRPSPRSRRASPTCRFSVASWAATCFVRYVYPLPAASLCNVITPTQCGAAALRGSPNCDKFHRVHQVCSFAASSKLADVSGSRW